MPATSDSYLFITLDSCRYDAFNEAHAPSMKAIGALHKAMAPGYFTFASHAAMFMGFLPGIADLQRPFLNSKFGKVFKLVGPAFEGKGTEQVTLTGRNIVHGLHNRGYLTLGTSGNQWFNQMSASGRYLAEEFDRFYFGEQAQVLPQQLGWLESQLLDRQGPVFVFLNLNETHVPYWYQGAPWSVDDNPCEPFSNSNDAAVCKQRQIACIQYIDTLIGPLLRHFSAANTIICSDHGDCWGEDGLWEHGFWHEKVFAVPLLMRFSDPAADEAVNKRAQPSV